jgi:hypothetical protein
VHSGRLAASVALLASALWAVSAFAAPVESEAAPPVSRSAVHVKFVEGSEVRLRGRRFTAPAGVDPGPLSSVLDSYAVEKIHRLFTRSEADVDRHKKDLEDRARVKLKDLNLHYRMTLPEDADRESFVTELRALGIVESAYPEPEPPPLPATPDLSAGQGYGLAAPSGIGARGVGSVPGGDGSRVKSPTSSTRGITSTRTPRSSPPPGPS